MDLVEMITEWVDEITKHKEPRSCKITIGEEGIKVELKSGTHTTQLRFNNEDSIDNIKNSVESELDKQ